VIFRTISANAAHPLAFTGADVTNQGTALATNCAVLNIFSATFDNQGLLQADAGSTINFKGSTNLLNYNGTSQALTGGTFRIAGTVQFTNAAEKWTSPPAVQITTNAANLILDGPIRFF
jgi:hypothetical protein